MKLSIVLCTSNRINYLRTAIKNLISQTLKDWELIVVEGDSYDGTHEMLVEMYCQGAIKHVVNRGNIVDARNLGYKYAEGEYIVFVDDDDTMVDSRFEIQTKILDENPHIDVVSCSTVLNKENGIIDTFAEHSNKTIKPLIEKQNAPLDFICFSKSCVFRKSTLDKIFTDGELCKQEFVDGCEMSGMIWRLYTKGAKFSNTTKTIFVYNYQMCKDSQSSTKVPTFYNENFMNKTYEEIKKVISKVYRKKKLTTK